MSKPVIFLFASPTDLDRDLNRCLTHEGFEVVRSKQVAKADLLSCSRPSLVIIDSSTPDSAADLETADRLRRRSCATPILFIARHSSEAKAIAAFRAGVTDYFKRPISYEELLKSIRRQLPPLRPDSLPAALTSPPEEGEPIFIGLDSRMLEIRSYIARAADLDCNVLITGETGTGKERVAELIHWYSDRRTKPMIALNCAALPENLVESELFGYERGAFTGAQMAYPGKLRLAEGGTFFFDEIFEMSPHMQAKILRALETRKIDSIGGRKSIPLNIRIVAATNLDPERAMEQGLLRQDLYYRLNVARIHLPPLRERPTDISLLLQHFVEEMNRRYHRQVEGFDPDVMALLMSYSWPGNIRELRNLVEVLFVNLTSRVVSMADLPETFLAREKSRESIQGEQERLLEALQATRWNKSQAAGKLKWSRMTLYRKMEQYGLSKSGKV